MSRAHLSTHVGTQERPTEKFAFAKSGLETILVMGAMFKHSAKIEKKTL